MILKKSIFILFSMLITSICIADVVDYDLSQYKGKYINSITIVRKNVFDDVLQQNSAFYYRWANKLHIITKESVIKGELLFHTGEKLEILKVEESIRNLRLRHFIGEVELKITPKGDESINIEVITTDNWTTKVALIYEQGGGNYTAGLAVSEDNILGYGRIIQFSSQLSNDNDGVSFLFHDDRVGKTRIFARVFYSNFTLSEGYGFAFGKKQYSLTVPFSFSSSFVKNDGTRRIYDNGSEIYRHSEDVVNFNYNSTYSLGLKYRVNLYLDYQYLSIRNSPDGAVSQNDHYIPADETRSYPLIGLGGSIIEYDLQRYLDEAGTPEDITLGAFAKFMIGRSASAFGADFIGTYTDVSAGFLVKPYNRLLIGGSDKLSLWHKDGYNQLIKHKSELMMYFKLANTQTLAARVLADFAWRQYPNYQVILGGTTGLRGFSQYSLAGDRKALFNFEYRFYFPVTILTAKLGGALFYDTGNVWQEGDIITFNNMKQNIGIGLRFGMTKSSTARIARFDFAKSLTDDDYYISMATGVVFSLKSIFNND